MDATISTSSVVTYPNLGLLIELSVSRWRSIRSFVELESSLTVRIRRFSNAATISALSMALTSPLSDMANCALSSPLTPRVLSDLESVTFKLIDVLGASSRFVITMSGFREINCGPYAQLASVITRKISARYG